MRTSCAVTVSPRVRRRRERRSWYGTAASPICRTPLLACGSRGQPRHFGFDPGLDRAGEVGRASAGWLDRRTDAHGNGAGPLDEGILRPHLTGVVRHRHDGRAGFSREPAAADSVAALLARRNAGPFGKHQHPEPLRELVLALGPDLLQCLATGTAVDGDRRE